MSEGKIMLLNDNEIQRFAFHFLDWFAVNFRCVKPSVTVWLVPQNEWNKLTFITEHSQATGKGLVSHERQLRKMMNCVESALGWESAYLL